MLRVAFIDAAGAADAADATRQAHAQKRRGVVVARHRGARVRVRVRRGEAPHALRDRAHVDALADGADIRLGMLGSNRSTSSRAGNVFPDRTL